LGSRGGPARTKAVSLHPRYARTIAAAIIALALGIRIAEVERTAYEPIGDAKSYLILASQIAHIGDYSSEDPGAGFSRGPTAYFAPAFPYLLAAVDELDGHHAAAGAAVAPARLTGALLGTAIVVLVGLLALELSGEWVALIALAIAALYPVLIELSAVIVAENLLVAIELAAVWSTLRARRSRSAGWAVATGVLIGLAALAHTNGILLALPLGLGLASLPGIGALRRSGPVIMLCAIALTIAPWVIRDELVLHQLVPISDEAGITLAGTYNPTSAASPDPPYKWVLYTTVPADADIAREAQRLSETQLGSRLISRALSYISARPLAPLEVAYDNTRRLLELEGAHAWRASAASIGVDTGTARIGVLGFWLLCALALAGACTRLARRAPKWVWGVPVLMWLSVVLVNAETPRFREAIDPFLIILAACALADHAGWACRLAGRERRDQRLGDQVRAGDVAR
jgi:4-amino-4-deoxy-L-arabinose transferase-like glycosyltransferase